jgi:flavorubredoxin
MKYERDQIVLVRYRQGAKLAKIVAEDVNRADYAVRIWNATSKVWSGITVRRPDLIMGVATYSEQRTYGMRETP